MTTPGENVLLAQIAKDVTEVKLTLVAMDVNLKAVTTATGDHETRIRLIEQNYVTRATVQPIEQNYVTKANVRWALGLIFAALVALAAAYIGRL